MMPVTKASRRAQWNRSRMAARSSWTIGAFSGAITSHEYFDQTPTEIRHHVRRGDEIGAEACLDRGLREGHAQMGFPHPRRPQIWLLASLTKRRDRSSRTCRSSMDG